MSILGPQCEARSPVPVADLLHDEQDGDPDQAHDKFAPLEVGCPRFAKQVLQLLVHGVVAWEGDGGQLQGGAVGRVGPRAVSENRLHLQVKSMFVSMDHVCMGLCAQRNNAYSRAALVLVREA